VKIPESEISEYLRLSREIMDPELWEGRSDEARVAIRRVDDLFSSFPLATQRALVVIENARLPPLQPPTPMGTTPSRHAGADLFTVFSPR
jgi:hypothetical protein